MIFQSSTSSDSVGPQETKWSRRVGSSSAELARPGMRTFCNFVNERPTQQLEAGRGRLRFKYMIKAALWHRTKSGLHKKKTKLAAKQARLRDIKKDGLLFCRKPHSTYWVRNAAKPHVDTDLEHPWNPAHTL